MLALRLEPPDEGAESKFGFFGEPPELRDGYGESECKFETKELLGEPRVGTSFKTRPVSLLRSSVPLRPWSCRYFGLVKCVVAASRARGECGRPARGDLLLYGLSNPLVPGSRSRSAPLEDSEEAERWREMLLFIGRSESRLWESRV